MTTWERQNNPHIFNYSYNIIAQNAAQYNNIIVMFQAELSVV